MTLGSTQSDAHDSMADTRAEVEAVKLGDTRGDALALLEPLADTLAEVNAKTLGETRGDAHQLVETLADTVAEDKAVNTRRHTGRFARTGR